MLGRFFERLEQRIKGLLGQHVDFVDDVDLKTAAAWPDSDILP